MSGFRKNLAAMYGVQALNMLLPLLTMPFLYRALGAEQFGRMAMALGLGMMAVMAVDAGFPMAALRLISRAAPSSLNTAKQPIGTARRILLATQHVRIGIGLLGALAIGLTLSMLPLDRGDRWLYAWAGLNVIGTLSFPQYYFTAQQLSVVLAWCHMIGRLVSACALIVMVRAPSDTQLAVIITSSATLLSGVCAHLWLRRTARLYFSDYFHLRIADIKLLAQKTAHLYPTQLLQAFIVNAPVLLLGAAFGKVEAGYYASVERIVRVFIAFIEPINTIGMPLLNRLRKNRSLAVPTGDQLLYATSSIGICGALLGAVAAHPLLQLLLGSSTNEQVLLLRCLLAWSVLHAMTRTLESMQLVVSNNIHRHREVVTWVIPAQLVTLYLASTYGSFATALGMVLTECVALALFARTAGLFRTTR